MKKIKILVVNTAEKDNEKYAMSITDFLKKSEPEIVHFKKIDAVDLSKYDGVILSGQPLRDKSYTLKKVKKYYSWVKNIDVPVIGFCGGHQIISLLYGGKLLRNTGKELNGFYAAYAKTRYLDHLIFNEIYFGKHGNVFIVYNNHSDSVTLPEDFVYLAETDRCKNAAMKHKTKPIFGSQFHPEDPDLYLRSFGINQHTNQDSDTMLKNFEQIVKKEMKYD